MFLFGLLSCSYFTYVWHLSVTLRIPL
jgi:hypothetical protein